MIAGLVLLGARRAAAPAVLALVAVAAALSFLDTTPTDLAALPELVDARGAGAPATAWLAALVVGTAWAAAAGGRMAQRWYEGEASWLAPSAPPRLSLASSGVLGAALGSATLAAVAGAVVLALGPPREGELLELEGLAGPVTSLPLLPGESFERTFDGGAAVDTVRVRLIPTVGGDAPATRVRLAILGESGDLDALEVTVLRRQWAEVHVPEGGALRGLELTNVGEGAVAVLGPRPVELWRRSDAWAGGHLRAAVLCGLLLGTVASLAAAAGAWLNPWIAGLLTAALALATTTGAVSSPLSPLVADVARALRALDEGRAPAPPGAPALAAGLGAVVVSALVILPALRRWSPEGRR